jgi:hypothetical protein
MGERAAKVIWATKASSAQHVEGVFADLGNQFKCIFGKILTLAIIEADLSTYNAPPL